jgi:hypothetical protein
MIFVVPLRKLGHIAAVPAMTNLPENINNNNNVSQEQSKLNY